MSPRWEPQIAVLCEAGQTYHPQHLSEEGRWTTDLNIKTPGSTCLRDKMDLLEHCKKVRFFYSLYTRHRHHILEMERVNTKIELIILYIKSATHTETKGYNKSPKIAIENASNPPYYSRNVYDSTVLCLIHYACAMFVLCLGRFLLCCFLLHKPCHRE